MKQHTCGDTWNNIPVEIHETTYLWYYMKQHTCGDTWNNIPVVIHETTYLWCYMKQHTCGDTWNNIPGLGSSQFTKWFDLSAFGGLFLHHQSCISALGSRSHYEVSSLMHLSMSFSLDWCRRLPFIRVAGFMVGLKQKPEHMAAQGCTVHIRAVLPSVIV